MDECIVEPTSTPGAAGAAASPTGPVAASDASADTPVRTMLIGGAVVTAIFVWVFWDFIATQVRWALREPADWGHTLAIPLIAFYLGWVHRDRVVAAGFRTTWFGLLPMLLGVGLYALCVFGPQAFWHHNLRGIGFGIALFGLVLLIVGWKAMKILWFPLAYLIVFSQTISRQAMDLVTLRLQDFAAVGAHGVLNVIGIDTDRSGNILTVWSGGVAHPLNVAEACSGMRMLVAFLALGVALAYLGLPFLWQRTLLVLLGVPVALVVNVLRVVTLGVLSLWDIEFAAGEFHNMIGLIWLMPAFLIYLGLMWILRSAVVDEEGRPIAA